MQTANAAQAQVLQARISWAVQEVLILEAVRAKALGLRAYLVVLAPPALLLSLLAGGETPAVSIAAAACIHGSVDNNNGRASAQKATAA